MTVSVAQDLSETDLMSEQVRMNPYPYYSELLSRAPVLWNSRHKAWLVSRHADVIAALRHEALGSDRIGPYVRSRIPPEDMPKFQRMIEILGRWALFLGPPDHTRLRGLVQRSFSPRRLAALKDTIDAMSKDLATKLRERLLNGETVDIVEDYCVPLPGYVVAKLFGVPVSDGPRLKFWAEELGLFVNGALGDPERNARVAAALSEFEKYLIGLIEQYRKEPADNILSGLVEVTDQGDKLNFDELIATCTLILDAGYKTVQNTLGNAVLTLLDRPEIWDQLVQTPSLVPTAVEEFLRFSPPGNYIIRRAVRDVEFGGQTIATGSRVYLIMGAANRDPLQFENPHEFRLDRKTNPHLSFGQGIHFCLGAPLARMEMTSALTALLQIVPRLQLAVPKSELVWHNVLVLRGVESIPVKLAAA